MAVVVLLLIPASRINPSDAETASQPAAADAAAGRRVLTAAGITQGVYKPFSVLVEGTSDGGSSPRSPQRCARPRGRERDGAGRRVVAQGRHGADRGALDHGRLVEGQPRGDLRPTEARPPDRRGGCRRRGGRDARRRAPEERDFVHAVYGNFGWVLLFVILLTFILLARAFRSIVLPLKAVVLNLISLGCAYGVVVFIFQEGHGSDLIWNVQATGVVISWIPLMIFAFLYGISMDYEVFMITRIREVYDETGDTREAISLGLARTGKLVTSGAGVLMFAFFALSTGPGLDIKLFGIGLAAGVIIDATLIRLLLVPSSMQLLGRWNWWLPAVDGDGAADDARARSSRAHQPTDRRARSPPSVALGLETSDASCTTRVAASCPHAAAMSRPRVRRTVAGIRARSSTCLNAAIASRDEPPYMPGRVVRDQVHLERPLGRGSPPARPRDAACR